MILHFCRILYNTRMPACLHSTIISSPTRNIVIEGNEDGIRRVQFTDQHLSSDAHTSLALCKQMLEEYFAGERIDFHPLRLTMHGTDFDMLVWDALLTIPFGSTVSYKELAKQIKHPKAARAVGNAVKRNPFHVLIPCHRVLPASGKPGNYAGGNEVKQWLLEHEQRS